MCGGKGRLQWWRGEGGFRNCGLVAPQANANCYDITRKIKTKQKGFKVDLMHFFVLDAIFIKKLFGLQSEQSF